MSKRLVTVEKKNSFNKKKRQANQAQGGPVICHNQLEAKGEKTLLKRARD